VIRNEKWAEGYEMLIPTKEQLLPLAIIEGCDIYLLSNELLKNRRKHSSTPFLGKHVSLKCFHSNVINHITGVCKKLFKLSEKSSVLFIDGLNANKGIIRSYKQIPGAC